MSDNIVSLLIINEGVTHMSQYQLPNGRQVKLSRFTLASTYIGVMEGSPEIASKYNLELISENAS